MENNSKENKQKIHQLANIHPYTTYYNNIFGSKNGMILQFNVPKKSVNYIDELFSQVHEYINISSYKSYTDEMQRYFSNPNLSLWNNGRWKFDFYGLNSSNSPYNMKLQDPSGLNLNLKYEDIILIRELMVNARRKISHIVRDIMKSDIYSTSDKNKIEALGLRQITREINKIKNSNIFYEFYLQFNKQAIGTINQIMVFGKLNQNDLNHVINIFQKSLLPFRSVFKLYKYNKFSWYIHLPSNNISNFLNYISEFALDLDIFYLDNTFENSRNYPLWHHNFEKDNNGYWKNTKDWMIYGPMQAVFRHKT